MPDPTTVGDTPGVAEWNARIERIIADGVATIRREEAAAPSAEDQALLAWHEQPPPHPTIPARFSHAHPDDLEGSLAALHARWVDDGLTRNVLLLGNVGVGKTHAAVAFLRTAQLDGRTVAFVPVVELLDDLRPNTPGGQAAINRALAPDVLVLDDLGGEKDSDWTVERVYRIVNRRWLEKRPTVATSNLDADGLRERVGDRTWSRLYHDALRLKIGGADRRREEAA